MTKLNKPIRRSKSARESKLGNLLFLKYQQTNPALSFTYRIYYCRKKQANKRAAPQEQQPVAESTWDDLDGYNVLKRPAIGRNAPEQRRPHPLPPRPAFSMTPAAQESQATPPREVHSISQLFAAGPPPLHPPPRSQ